MNKILIFPILFVLFFLFCGPYQNGLTLEIEEEIKDTLEKIAVENLTSWEPPFYEEKLLKPFTHNDDFSVVIDGFPIKNYEIWKKVVYESMQEDREKKFKQYKHVIKDIRTSVLSKNSGVVTIIYTWDYVTKDDLHYNTNGAVTLTFKFKDDSWKIIHFHCSHGDEKLINESIEKSN